MQKTIIFIYNANSDKWNKYIDYVHKIVSPSTYSCDLCNLTYGSFSEIEIWKNFRETTQHTLIFTYKDEFLRKNPKNEYKEFKFPIILEEKGNKFDVLIGAEMLNSIDSTEDLIEILQSTLD